MPPRYAYWTILVDGQPTAFRAAMQEDLTPTFNRLKQKHSSAEMKWFQNGKLWGSRDEAQEAMRERGERGRIGDKRQGGGFRDRKRSQDSEKLAWKPRGPFDPADGSGAEGSRRSAEREEGRESRRSAEREGAAPKRSEKLDWKPKGEFTPAAKRDRADRPDWKPREERSFKKPGGFKSSRPPSRFPDRKPSRSREGAAPKRSEKLDWKPKGAFTPAPKRADRGEWNSKSFTGKGRESRRSSGPASGGGRKLDWTPKSGHTGAKPERPSGEKRKWIPKEEYKKSQGIEARRDKNWRPGGDHKDPRQKYKDAKKAKWTKFKANIRKRWDSKQGKKKHEE